MIGLTPFVAPEILRRLAQPATPERIPPTVYVVSTDGTANGDGSMEHPFNLERVQDLLKPGDRVLFSGGVYRSSRDLHFGIPQDRNAEVFTEFAALPGERPIFTDRDGNPPTVHVGDYTHLKELWFGGKKGAGGGFFMGGSPIGRMKVLEGCTIFNYQGGIAQGSAKDVFYHRNRLVGNGKGRYSHSIYLSGGDTSGAMSHHIVFDHNTVIGDGDKNGWGIHGWHYPKNMIITGNFTADVIANVMGGGEHGLTEPGDNVVANNFFYRSTGSREEGGYVDQAWGMWVASPRTLCANNIFTDQAPPLGSLDLSSHNIGIGSMPSTGAQYDQIFSHDDLPSLVGISHQTIDTAIACTQEAFRQDVDALYTDQNIERYFATLNLSLYPPNSSLHSLGAQWYDQSLPATVGPAGADLTDFSEFWQAFPRHLLGEWDEWGNVTSSPQKYYFPLTLAG